MVDRNPVGWVILEPRTKAPMRHGKSWSGGPRSVLYTSAGRAGTLAKRIGGEVHPVYLREMEQPR